MKPAKTDLSPVISCAELGIPGDEFGLHSLAPVMKSSGRT